MAITKEKLAEILNGKARILCSESVQNNLRPSRSLNNPNPADYDSDAEYFDNLVYNSDEEEPSNIKTDDFVITQNSIANSNVPSFIKESMSKNHIDTSSMANISVIDKMSVGKKQQNKKNIVTENKHQNPQPQTVDYTIIKAIVNECLNSFFEKQGFLSNIQLKNGNIIITDHKGVKYAAKLEKITE